MSQTKIDVSGRGTASLKPDVAHLTVTVKTSTGEDLYTAAPASEENNKIMKSVLDTLEKFKIEEKDIKTAVFRVEPEFGPSREFKGFSATNAVTIKIRNLDDVGPLCSVLLENKSITVNTPYFKLEDPSVLEIKARELAFQEAKKKADQIASFSGLKVTGVELVTDGQVSHALARTSNHKNIRFEGYDNTGRSGYSGYSGTSGYSGASGYSGTASYPIIFESDETMWLNIAVTFIAEKN